VEGIAGRRRLGRGELMAIALFGVKATIPKSREKAFNRWYDDTHVPDVLKFPGVVSARRHRALEGEDTYQYTAVYEVRDEQTNRALMKSGAHDRPLAADCDEHFGKVSERARSPWVQVFP
jgi:hypothetical protein